MNSSFDPTYEKHGRTHLDWFNKDSKFYDSIPMYQGTFDEEEFDRSRGHVEMYVFFL